MPHAPGPLVREVELPRRAGVWGPILALLAAAMITIMTGIALTARPSHVRAHHLDHRATTVVAPTGPATVPVRAHAATPPIVTTPAAPADDRCADRIRRASPDDVAAYESCTAPR